MPAGNFLRGLAILLCTSLHAVTAQASDEPVLTVTSGEQTMSYTLEDLRALPASEIETATIWTEGVQHFTGVSLHNFLDTIGVTDGTIRATAINDYSVEIPVSDAVENGPIIAYEHNGQTMSRRSKGPLWIIYPYDSEPIYQSETYFSRSIWQLDRITVQ